MRFLLFSLLILVAQSANALPNVVFIVVDDLGYGELSCQDPATDVPTPHIDTIAKNGVRFTSGYITAPYCAPSRAGLLTGRYQTRFGFEFNPVGARNEDPQIGLPVILPTLADILRSEAGYSTALIGKWHLGGPAEFHPLRRGFDEFFGFLHEGHFFRPVPYPGMTTWLRRKTLPGGETGRWTSGDGRLIYSTHMGHREPDYDANNPLYRNGQPVIEEANLTDAFSREAVTFIERCGRERPFFLYLAYNAVHSPLQADNVYLERFAGIGDIQRRIFAAMLAQLDDGVGQVLAAVEAEGLRENTLVVFLSDNGGATKELTSRNTPLRGGKGELYEGGIRVPFLMQFPGKIAPGSVVDDPFTSLDLIPTALALAGVAADRPLDGQNLLPRLTGEITMLPPRPLYWRMGQRAALREGDWKIVRSLQQKQEEPWELYHLKDDLEERTDRAATEPAVLEHLVQEWEQIDAGMVEPLFR